MFRKILAGLALIFVLAAASLVALLPRMNLAGFAAGRASASLGRRVTIAGLHVVPGRWLGVTLDGATLANSPGFSRRDMASLLHATAEIDAASLLLGPLTLRHLRIEGATLSLEHKPDGGKNWKAGMERARPSTQTGRGSDPTILDASLHDFAFTYRGSSLSEISVKTAQATLEARDRAQPATLAASGTYNAAPVSLAATLGSFDALRDAAKPFPIDLRLASRDARIRFQGTMTDPLNAEGAAGTATVDAPDPSQLLELAGASSTSIPPITVAGPFTHRAEIWAFTNATGTLKTMPFTAKTLSLAEGADGKPDQVTADIAFDRLDLGFLDISAPSRTRTQADISLSVDRTPGALIDAKLAATRLTYGGLVFDHARLDASLTPGQIELRALSLGYLGATGTATAKIAAMGDGGRVTLDADLAGIDLLQLGRSLGVARMKPTGNLAVRISATAEGKTVRDATRSKTIAAVATMASGTVPRAMVELASTDIRTLFRHAEGTATITCALAVATLHGNAGRLSRLRIRATPGTIGGAGTFDLAAGTLDLVVGSQAATTGAFALDIPIRVSGSMRNPSMVPATLTPAGQSLLATAGTIPPLPPALAAALQASPCAK